MSNLTVFLKLPLTVKDGEKNNNSNQSKLFQTLFLQAFFVISNFTQNHHSNSFFFFVSFSECNNEQVQGQISIALGGLCVLLIMITIALLFKVQKLKTGMFRFHHSLIRSKIITYNNATFFCVLLFSSKQSCAAGDTQGKLNID